jgi:putative membrane protein
MIPVANLDSNEPSLRTIPEVAPESGAFCAQALAAGEVGMQAAEIALQKSPSADVRAFAMVAMVEHCRISGALQSLAGRRCPQFLSESGADIALGELQNIGADDFDAAFATGQVVANEAVVALLERSAADIDDLELQDFARSTLPIFIHRLEQAQALAAAHPLR